jgi:hypothetical protein
LETALYFPYIEVPNTAWFMQILLYWDGAATIVPVNERGQTKLGRNMQALNDSGLLTFVSPLQWRRNDILGKVFLSFLERNGWVPLSRPERILGFTGTRSTTTLSLNSKTVASPRNQRHMTGGR